MIKRRAAAYIRFSSENQRDESLDAQLRAIKSYAEHNNLEIVKVYSDKAKSATSDKRPEFQQMIQDSALGIFDVVIVHKLDRFSRNKYDNVLYKKKLKKNGVSVISVTENIDGSPESIILESLLEGMAEYYSKNLAREVMKGLKETAYQCKHTGGTPPLGYDVGSDRKYQINEAEAVIVREIFRLYLDGYGYDKIITKLNEKGYRTKTGRPFGKNSLHDIICNEKYSGVFVFNRRPSKDAMGKRNNHRSKDDSSIIRIEDGLPAIISKEDFEIAKAKMETNKKRSGQYKAKELYLLSGLIFCGECGYAMQGNLRTGGKNPNKYVSYRCGNKEMRKACDNKEIRREHIENYVLSELENRLLNEENIPKLLEMLNEYQQSRITSSDEELQLFRIKLSEVNRQIDNIVNAISSGFVQEAFKEKMEDLEAQKAAIETNITELTLSKKPDCISEDQMRQMFSMFRHFVKEKNIPECKKFISSYVEKVLIFKDHVEVTFKVAFSLEKNSHYCFMTSKISNKALSNRYKIAV